MYAVLERQKELDAYEAIAEFGVVACPRAMSYADRACKIKN